MVGRELRVRGRVFSVDRSGGYTRKERVVEVIMFRCGRAEQFRRGLSRADRELAFQKVSVASSLRTLSQISNSCFPLLPSFLRTAFDKPKLAFKAS